MPRNTMFSDYEEYTTRKERRKCLVKLWVTDDEHNERTSQILNLYDNVSLSKISEKMRWSDRFEIAPYSGVVYNGEPLFLGDTIELNGNTLTVAEDKDTGYYLKQVIVSRIGFNDLKKPIGGEVKVKPLEAETEPEPITITQTTSQDATKFEERPIPRAPGYTITPNGTVYSVKRRKKKVIVPKCKSGNNYVQLKFDGKHTARRVDFLVVITYIDAKLKNVQKIVHKNGNLLDSSLENLEIDY